MSINIHNKSYHCSKLRKISYAIVKPNSFLSLTVASRVNRTKLLILGAFFLHCINKYRLVNVSITITENQSKKLKSKQAGGLVQVKDVEETKKTYEMEAKEQIYRNTPKLRRSKLTVQQGSCNTNNSLQHEHTNHQLH